MTDDGVDGVGSSGTCTASSEADLAPVAQARISSAGGCTVGENVPGTSEFAAAPGVADPHHVSMAVGVPDGLAPLRNAASLGARSSDGGCTVGGGGIRGVRISSAGVCTVGENVPGTSEFAAAPGVADPLLVSMAGGVPDGLAPLRNAASLGARSSDGGWTVGGEASVVFDGVFAREFSACPVGAHTLLVRMA